MKIYEIKHVIFHILMLYNVIQNNLPNFTRLYFLKYTLYVNNVFTQQFFLPLFLVIQPFKLDRYTKFYFVLFLQSRTLIYTQNTREIIRWQFAYTRLLKLLYQCLIVKKKCQYSPFKNYAKHKTYATSRCQKSKRHKKIWKITKCFRFRQKDIVNFISFLKSKSGSELACGDSFQGFRR